MFEIASTALVLSIIFAGILIGVGYAFRLKTYFELGKEELIASIFNAAIIGIYSIIISTLISLSFICDISEKEPCKLLVIQQKVETSITLLSDIIYSLNRISNVKITIGHISYVPFEGLNTVAQTLSYSLSTLSILNSLILFNLYIIKNWFFALIEVLITTGILFRLFFPSRLAGNFLIGLAIGIVFGYSLSAHFISEKVMDDVSSLVSEISSISANLSWLPEMHFGDQGVIENIADKSVDIRTQSKKAIIITSKLISAVIFPSIVLFFSGLILSLLFSYAIYRAFVILKI